MEGTNKKLSSVRIPSLVLELLLEYLDFFTFQTLRLVSKTTKQSIETPEVLRHFVVRITSAARLEEVLNAPDPVSWNSFVFKEKTEFTGCLTSADIQRFLAAYGDLVLHLEFNWTWDRTSMLSLLSGCPHLESLQSKTLYFEPKADDMNNRLLENWKNLRHFHINQFVADRKRPEMGMSFFSQMLSACTKLQTVTVPNFTYFPEPMEHMEYGDNFQRLMIIPLLDTIAKGRLRSVTVPPEGFDDELLLRLAIVCREKATILELHMEYRLTHRFLVNQPPEHLSVLDIIANLPVVTDTIIRQPLTNVRRMHLNDLHIRNDAYAMPSFPHLSELEFDYHESLELFVNRLVAVQRPQVKSLSISSSRRISPVVLCASFVNLRVLHLYYWKAKDDEWLKLWPLVGHTLVELELYNCPNLSDRGILGDDLNQPAFLQLKHLRKLELRNRNVEERWPGNDKITEPSFVHAFRHMRLRYFHFLEGTMSTSNRFSAETVEAMWSGPFGETIETFRLQEEQMLKRCPGTQVPRRVVSF